MTFLPTAGGTDGRKGLEHRPSDPQTGAGTYRRNKPNLLLSHLTVCQAGLCTEAGERTSSSPAVPDV